MSTEVLKRCRRATADNVYPRNTDVWGVKWEPLTVVDLMTRPLLVLFWPTSTPELFSSTAST